jgi:hypothetical protein
MVATAVNQNEAHGTQKHQHLVHEPEPHDF